MPIKFPQVHWPASIELNWANWLRILEALPVRFIIPIMPGKCYILEPLARQMEESTAPKAK